MISTKIVKSLNKNKTINRILKTIFLERNIGKPGLTISELSAKTGIERHRLAGIIDVLVILGILAIFNIGMMKVIAPTETLLRMKNIIIHLK